MARITESALRFAAQAVEQRPSLPLLVSRGVATVLAVGTSAAAVLPAGMVGYVHLPAALGIGLGAMIAAPWGVRLAHRLSGRALARVFAAALAAVGVALLWP